MCVCPAESGKKNKKTSANGGTATPIATDNKKIARKCRLFFISFSTSYKLAGVREKIADYVI